jgi:hypothetical protein
MIRITAICDKCQKVYEEYVFHSSWMLPKYRVIDGFNFCQDCEIEYKKKKDEMLSKCIST